MINNEPKIEHGTLTSAVELSSKARLRPNRTTAMQRAWQNCRED
jgi:hypothetical protein